MRHDHMSEDKRVLLVSIETVLDCTMTDSAWNALCSLTRLELAAVELWLKQAILSKSRP